MGNVTEIDSANVFVENWDFGSVLTISGSATGTYTGSDFTNLRNKGGKFFLNFSTIGATCTVRVGIQSKDSVSGLYITVASLSLDGLTTGNKAILQAVHFYPGISTTPLGSNETNISETFTRTMRVFASITATASVSTAGGVTMTIGLSKIL